MIRKPINKGVYSIDFIPCYKYVVNSRSGGICFTRRKWYGIICKYQLFIFSMNSFSAVTYVDKKYIRNFELILVEHRVFYLPSIKIYCYWHFNIYLHTWVPNPKVRYDSFISFTSFCRNLIWTVPRGWMVRGSNTGRARFSAPVQTGPEAHPAYCTMGPGSFPGVRCSRSVTLTPHPLLVQRSKIE